MSIISPCLASLYNGCISTGNFPDILKIGKITPIFKKGDSQNIKNYRPISTLPIFGKIFEKIIYTRLYSFLTSQHIIHDKQFGFRQTHSTSHALHYSIEHVKDALRSREHVLGIFIDLSKAFDTIDHKILQKKLEHYGVRGNTLSLLNSYMTNRKQSVKVLGETSDVLPVTFGYLKGAAWDPFYSSYTSMIL